MSDRKRRARALFAVTLLLLLVACDRRSQRPVVLPSPSPSTTAPPTATAPPSQEPEIAVPDVERLPLAKATRTLEAAGFSVSVRERLSHEPARSVLGQGVAPGQMAEAGSVVTLVVALPFPRVPAVVGLALPKARDALRSEGFGTEVKLVYSDEVRNHLVISQSPAGRDEARPGRTIHLVVSQGPDCVDGYSVCLSHAHDYDCAGGSGEPPWVYGTVRVTGYDPYHLDADNDGWGCE